MKFFKRNQLTERNIYQYWDGHRMRAADPMVIFRAIIAHPKFNLDAHLKDMASGHVKASTEASAIAVGAVREIFGIPAWNENNAEGLTEVETLDVLARFLGWSEGLKKNGNGQQTSPVATAQESSGPSTTNANSPSGS